MTSRTAGGTGCSGGACAAAPAAPARTSTVAAATRSDDLMTSSPPGDWREGVAGVGAGADRWRRCPSCRQEDRLDDLHLVLDDRDDVAEARDGRVGQDHGDQVLAAAGSG